MAYIFRKISNLIDEQKPALRRPQGQIIGQTPTPSGETGVKNAPENASAAHESTFKNPNAIYDANYGANMGQLSSGIKQSLDDANTQLQNSTKEYSRNVGDIAKNYNYNGRSDVENIERKDVYDRLSTLATPDVAKNTLGAIESKSKYYNADTSATANLSTIDGLTNQLQNQNGSTRGGSRLDALLYRNSGQAGRAIRNDLTQIDGFRAGKEQLLNNEKSLLDNSKRTVDENSKRLYSDGDMFRNELMRSAQSAASERQAQFNARRSAELQKLAEWKKSQDYKNMFAEKIMEGAGDNYIKANQEAALNVKNKLLENTLKNFTLDDVRENDFVSPMQTYNENMFLDGRFNKIGALLGMQQRARESAPEINVSARESDYRNAINSLINARAEQAKAAAAKAYTPEYTAETGGGGGNNLLLDGITGGMYSMNKSLYNGANKVGREIERGIKKLKFW
ncbi:hypothetical protein [Fluviispira vulneris]|uniref:hypothetical protein n=1 Tax=Fluviispira vulneris TaxID=2763012 RepID=UPI001647EAEF|nr:hypothetical protein [Fluviispira vulneris]